jgi:hypothetical protein
MTQQLFLGFVPRPLPDEYLISYFSKFSSSPSTLLSFATRERSLFTNYKILVIENDEAAYSKILSGQHLLCNQSLVVWEYKGAETYDKFISQFSSRCVFLSGVPLSINTDEIFDEINSQFELLDLFVLKNGLKVNKHYGFATFKTEIGKRLAVTKKKFKTKKFKISCKNFELNHLEKLSKNKKGKKNGARQQKKKMLKENYCSTFDRQEALAKLRHSSINYSGETHHQEDPALLRSLEIPSNSFNPHHSRLPNFYNGRQPTQQIQPSQTPQLCYYSSWNSDKQAAKRSVPMSALVCKLKKGVQLNHFPRNLMLNMGEKATITLTFNKLKKLSKSTRRRTNGYQLF